MPLKYNIIEIFTSEEARWKGVPLWQAILDEVRSLKIAARVIVTRGLAGCYENGELASNNIEILSFNMPIKIEIILPSEELAEVLPTVEEMVADGIVVVEDTEVRVHRTQKRLIPRQLRVKDIMTKSPHTVSEGTPVNEIVRLLLSSEFNAVPVVDMVEHPIGIVTHGDLITKAGMPVRLGLLAQLEEEKVENYLASISHKTAGEVMTKPVITVHEDKRLGEAVDLMLKHHLKRLPVVNSEGILVGMLARSDIFHAITRETPDWEAIQARNVYVEGVTYVKDIMRRDTHTVSPDAAIEEVVSVIDSNDIQRVAVVDANGKLLGLISDRDLLGLFSEHRAGLWDYLVRKLPFSEVARRHEEFIAHTRAKTAREVMNTDLVIVNEDTCVDEAIRLMAERGIKRLPVVDENGVYKGMVSRDSVLRAGVKRQ
jgi:CBS domain-containing protein